MYSPKNNERTWEEWQKYLCNLYREYREKYFRDRLPVEVNVRFGICAREFPKRNYHTAGFMQDFDRKWVGSVGKEYDITIDWEYRHLEDVVCIVLLHEMAHVVVSGEWPSHGPKFKAEIRRLIRVGAYDDLL